MSSELVTMPSTADAAPAANGDGAHRLVDPQRHADQPATARQHRTAVLRLIEDESHRLGFVALPIFLSDLAGLVISLLVGLVATWTISGESLSAIGLLPLAIVVPVLLGNFISNLYPGVGLNPVVEFRQQSRVVMVTYVAMAMILLLTVRSLSAHVFLAVAFASQFVVGPIARAAVRARFKHRRWWGYPTIALGAGEAAKTVINNLIENPTYGLRPIAVLDPSFRVKPDSHEHVMGIPILGTPRLAPTLSRRIGVRYAILALPDLSRADSTRVLERYAERIPHVLITSAISPFAPGLPILWRDARDFAGVAGVEVRNRLMQPFHRFTKRFMDLSLTVCGGFCILPLIIFIAVAIKVSSPGPIFFGHTRLGRNGERFKAWKFRSMVTNGDAVLRDLLARDPAAAAEWARDHKLKNDPRVTKIGAFLRKTSLDELPQLWNVLKSEMALVGPRPIVRDEIEKYGRHYATYKAVRPGVTGLWQVSGRNDTTYNERVQLDEFYVRNWSPWVDLHVLARTVTTLLFRKGAY